MLMEPDVKEEELVFWEERGQWEGVVLRALGVPTQPRDHECPLVAAQRTEQD